jgi:hypothetical protein
VKEKTDKIYAPSADEQKTIDLVEGKFDRWKPNRRQHEIQWFINAAMVSGQQNIEFDRIHSTVRIPDTPTHKQRFVVNRIFPKYRSRLAKFLKGRPVPIIVPASTDREDKMNAKATQKVLDYLWRKISLETKYKDALEWAAICGKGFWWYHWDFTAKGRIVKQTILGPQVETAALGDPDVEVGSAFEVLVPDLGITRIGDQPEIMRIKVRDIEDVRKRYPELADFIKPDTNRSEVFQYERQIASLTPRGNYLTSQTDKKNEGPSQVMVKELFVRPSKDYPDGRYVVVANHVLLKEDVLPYKFSDCPNPYPVTEFFDTQMAGRFYPTTVVEQLIGPQREYNLTRSKVAEQIRLNTHPKILVPQQCQMSEDAWSSEAGEVVTFVALPGIEGPKPWFPPNIASDAWRHLDAIREEFDAISQIYPATEGSTGGAQSGFQTNLLQEAADAAHLPDIRSHELSVEEAAFKLRRLCAIGYDVPRLITVVGRNYEPEAMEFSRDQIDENAEVIVQIGSGLPAMKASKIQSVMELWDRGILGSPQDPENQRRTLSALDLGELESMQEMSRRDEDLVKLEHLNLLNSGGQQLAPPNFYDNHQIHFSLHTDELKSVESQSWPPEQRQALTIHVLQHMEYINPVAAWNMAVKLGLADPHTGQGVVSMPMMPPPTGPGGPAPQPPSQPPAPSGPPAGAPPPIQ